MPSANKIRLNFSGGEVSPELIARADIPVTEKVLQRMENWIALPTGPARFRAGSRHVRPTRKNNYAVYIEFQFSDIQAYLIEATQGYFRFFRNEGPILVSSTQNITGVTQASPAVVTSNSHGYVDDEEVYLDGLAGMEELNGRYFYVDVLTANTFALKDIFGNNIDSTGYTAYSSGGTSNKVYEVKTPYLEADLQAPSNFEYDQNADTMYIDSQNYAPRKLTRTAHDNWSLARYSRTNDQFEADNVTFGTITAINTGTDTISDASHTFVDGDHVYISGVVGTTEINDRHFLIDSQAAGTYKLKDYFTGLTVDMTNAWVSGGVVELVAPTRSTSRKYPGAVGFTDDARLGHHGTLASPESSWFSRGPSAAGAVRFDDFTTGSAASDALFFTLAPLRGRVDAIRWATNTDKYIALGTFGSVRRMFGASETASISADDITAKSANSDGVSRVSPVLDGPTLFYISRSGLALEALEYDYQIDGYLPDDKNLISSHLTKGGLIDLARQIGRPTIIWTVRMDGRLLGMTFKGKENIAGWHQHTLGGEGVVESIGIMPRENQQEQLWMIVRREINGQTVRYHEFFTDWVEFPVREDFFTGFSEEHRANDEERFINYLNEVSKHAINIDSSLTYNGNVYGLNASASITMGQDADYTDAEDVEVTASANVFTADMVGREIWGAYTVEGIGGGRLEITDYVSPTVVRGTVLDSFPATATYEAGDWFITATTVSGLEHLEGEQVAVITDGAVPDEDFTVVNGSVEWTQPASVVHVGLQYVGIMKSMPIDQGGQTGPALNKQQNISKVAFRFDNSAGVKYGTSFYDLRQITFRRGIDFTDRSVPLYTGVEDDRYDDSWTNDKCLFVVQDTPLPTTVICFDIYTETADE